MLWSTAEVVTRMVIGRITPIQLAGTRFTIGAVCLLLFLPFDLKRKNLRINARVLKQAAWLSLIGIVWANLSYQYSLKYAGAGVVATMFGTSPLFTLLLSAAILKEPLDRAKLAGVVLGLAGIAVLATSEHSATFSLIGFGFALSCSVSLSIFTVYVKKLAGPYAGLPITALCAGIGAAYFVPMVLWEGQTDTLGHVGDIWLPLLYLSVGTTGITYYLFFKALEHVDATKAISMLFLKPPVAAVLAAVVLGEAVTWKLALSMLVIVGGLYLVLLSPKNAGRVETRSHT
jgi:drug/metabolite transporter (DMT)-like permease